MLLGVNSVNVWLLKGWRGAVEDRTKTNLQLVWQQLPATSAHIHADNECARAHLQEYKANGGSRETCDSTAFLNSALTRIYDPRCFAVTNVAARLHLCLRVGTILPLETETTCPPLTSRCCSSSSPQLCVLRQEQRLTTTRLLRWKGAFKTRLSSTAAPQELW